MFGSVVRYHSVLNCLAQDDANFKHCPSRDEWNRVFFFFFREFQPMASALNNNSLSSDQDINRFLV